MTSRRPGAHALTFIFITILVDTIGFGIILPVMPELIMELTGEGLSRASIYGGSLAFSFAVMQFFASPVIGNLSDRFGRRPVLLMSLAAFGVDYLLMGFSRSIIWLFIGRVIAGITGAANTTATAYIADITPPEKRAQSFGLIGAAFGIGFILGPAIGGLLGGLSPRAPFFVAAGLALTNVLYGFFVVPESLPLERRRPFHWTRAHPLGTLRHLRQYPGVVPMISALFVWQLAHQALPSAWAFYTMFKFGWSEALVGASLAFAGVTIAIVQGGLTRVIIPKLGERRAARFGLIVGTLGFFGYAAATTGWMMYVVMAVFAFAGLVYPSINGLMSQRVSDRSQGELQGGVTATYSLSSIIGPPFMTGVFRYFTRDEATTVVAGAPFYAAALLGAVALWMFTRAARRYGSVTHSAGAAS
ncbi:MAG TPA: TCR/Tet family MFS transporter [Gemmatimonadaceae bacterium]|nr:TCR/Tet family MFS transporter [Gemmatimonadaceae bacterium]